MNPFFDEVHYCLKDSDLSNSDQQTLVLKLQALLNEQKHASSEHIWQACCQNIFHQDVPFTVQRLIYRQLFKDWQEQNPKRDPALWLPSQDLIAHSNAGQLMRELGVDNYEDLYQWSIQHYDDFLQRMLKRLNLQFKQAPSSTFTLAKGVEFPDWLPDAQLNIVESCFTQTANTSLVAIRSQSNDGKMKDCSYSELQILVERVSFSLKSRGIKPGARIAIAMPISVDAIAAFLGIIAAGCSAVMIAESFSSEEIRTRLDIAKPVLVFTQDQIPRGSKSLPLYAKVTEATELACIVLSENNSATPLRDQDQAWGTFLLAQRSAQFHYSAADTEIIVLFSSGTTGTPKAIPWTHCMPIKSAIDGHLHHDLHPADVVAWPTSLGWMMGPWLVFASLLNKSCIALSQHVPSSRAFGEFIQDAHVTMLGLVPSLVSAWRQSQCMVGLNWNQIRLFSSTGECSNSEDMHYLMSLANYKPIIEYCGGTETGGGYISGTVVKPCIPGTFSSAALGFNWVLLDQSGKSTDNGEVFFSAPSIGLSNRLLNADHHAIYYADTPTLAGCDTLRRHGDHIEHIGNGYYRAHGRIDDSMNLGGIKVSSAEIEQLLQQHPQIKELAAIAVPPKGGGPSRLIIAIVLNQGIASQHAKEIRKDLQSLISTKLNPLFKIHAVLIVDALPRTASNKVMRRVLRDLYEKQELST